MDALDFLRTLLDPDRLAVLGGIATTARSAEELSELTGLERRRVLAILGPLVQAQVAHRDGDAYRLRAAALIEMAHALPRPQPPAPEVLFGMTADEQATLARFFQGDRLIEIPVSRSKRRVVLERLALDFEPGVRYAEKEVNAMLARYHDDYASLRRHLVDEGLLDRSAGEYWRSGGRV